MCPEEGSNEIKPNDRIAIQQINTIDASINEHPPTGMQTEHTDIGFDICNEALQLHGGYG